MQVLVGQHNEGRVLCHHKKQQEQLGAVGSAAYDVSGRDAGVSMQEQRERLQEEQVDGVGQGNHHQQRQQQEERVRGEEGAVGIAGARVGDGSGKADVELDKTWGDDFDNFFECDGEGGSDDGLDDEDRDKLWNLPGVDMEEQDGEDEGEQEVQST
jgi:hypothetical protein